MEQGWRPLSTNPSYQPVDSDQTPNSKVNNTLNCLRSGLSIWNEQFPADLNKILEVI